MDELTCMDCGEIKPLDCFHETRRRPRKAQCKECMSKSNKRALEEKRLKRVKATYGLNPVQYRSLLEASDWTCAICGNYPVAKQRQLHIDHDHKSLEVRGCLCERCNRGLERFMDNPDLLRAAVAYLTKPDTGLRAPSPKPKRRKKTRTNGKNLKLQAASKDK